MTYAERPAPDGLVGIVTRTWHLQMPPVHRFEKILPLPFVHIIVNLSAPYRIFDRSGHAVLVPDAFVSGLQADYLVIESPPLIHHVGIELTPAGLSALAPDAAAATAGRVQDARAVLPGIHALVAELRAGEAEPLAAVDRYLRHLVPAPVDPVVAGALDLIGADPDIPIGAVAAQLGVTHRNLIARCRVATGTTPKQHAQVVRFHRLIDAVHTGGAAPDWAGLAASAGYYDQPHVVRAFRRFSGWSPTEYHRVAAEHGPDAAHFVPLEQVPVQARA